MSTSANRTRGAVPTRMAAAAAALALLAAPMPASAGGPSRTALLTLTDGSSLSALADRVVALGGQVLHTLDLSDSLVVQLPARAMVPVGATEVPDVPMRVNGVTAEYRDVAVPTYRETIVATPADRGDGVRVAFSRGRLARGRLARGRLAHGRTTCGRRVPGRPGPGPRTRSRCSPEPRDRGLLT